MASKAGLWSVAAAVGAIVLSLGAAAAAQDAAAVRTNTFTLSAQEAFEKGMGAFGVQRNLKTGDLELYDQAMIEDDGPGIATTNRYLDRADRAVYEEFNDQRLLKKILHVERPEALEARLECRARGATAKVNGQPVKITGQVTVIPASLIKKGDNEIIFGEGDKSAMVTAQWANIVKNAPERANGPRRSFTSTDGGKTWQVFDGEWEVRFILTQHPAEGHVISPVIDLSKGKDDASLLLGKVAVKKVTLTIAAETPAGTKVDLTMRTGSTPVYEAKFWSEWNTAFDRVPAGHRYLQWQATLKTASPTVTPVLKSVTVVAEVAAAPLPDWAQKVTVGEVHNQEIRYTSMPFEYETPNQPKLVVLREKYKLDAVVAPGKTEFERQVLLKQWVRDQWGYKPPEGHYPDWDADEIMSRKMGFCVQYAIVYVECAAALGWEGRFVFGEHPDVMGGHEVSEVWSNQYSKWVLIDPEGNRHYWDPQANIPLSMLEVHNRMVKLYYGDKMATVANNPKEKVWADNLVTASGRTLVPTKPTSDKPKDWPAWTKWLTMHYVPRNNFYSKPHPLPLAQGWGWDWPYYWVWTDAQTPREVEYPNLTNRRSDLEWTLNQVRFDASYGAEAGTIDVQMGTSVTPNFETLLVNVDGKGWEKSGSALAWKLHSGKNRLEMRVRKTLGVEGPVSSIELNYQ